MTNFKGTQGKWVKNTYHNDITIKGKENHKYVANFRLTFSENDIDLRTKANALLISKAPEMLEMLQKIYNIENGAFGLKSFNVEDLKREIDSIIKSATELEV